MDVSEHAKVLSALGASKGGKARAEKLSAEQRQAIAKRAAEQRWGPKPTAATHVGELTIGDLQIPCAVLEDGTRVLSETGVIQALGLYRSGAVHVRGRDAAEGGAQLPLFVANKNLKPFVDSELASVLQNPCWYSVAGGGIRNKGFDARLLPKVCEVWLRARDAGALRGARQPIVAGKADVLMRGLAHVGIIALVDEATGYQYDRARHALEEILDAFIKDELGKWAKRFPDEFYTHLFRLKGLQFIPFPTKRPRYVGLWTTDLVYKRIAPGILDELKRKNPPDSRGRRRHRHHQWLTDDVGHPKLQEHLNALVVLMRSCDTWDDFYHRLNKSLPRFKAMPLLDWAEKQAEQSGGSDASSNDT